MLKNPSGEGYKHRKYKTDIQLMTVHTEYNMLNIK